MERKTDSTWAALEAIRYPIAIRVDGTAVFGLPFTVLVHLGVSCRWSCGTHLLIGRRVRMGIRSIQGQHSKFGKKKKVDSIPERVMLLGGWFVERGSCQALETQVRIAMPRSSIYLQGRNVGHFHSRP